MRVYQTDNTVTRPIFHVESIGEVGGSRYPMWSYVSAYISAAAIFCLPSTQRDMGVEKEW